MDQTPSPSQSPASSPETPANPVAEAVPQFSQSKPKTKLPVLPLLGGVGVVLALIIGFFVFRFISSQVKSPVPSKSTPARQVRLVYWGLWEPTDVLQNTIKEFEKQNPGVTIEYAQQSPKDYRERLQGAFARGQGPDIYRFHNTWVPMLSQANVLSTVPSSVLASGEFEKTYYPNMVKDLKTTQGIVGLPMMTDGLGLYINKKMLTASGKSVPTTWDELRSLGRDLTIVGENGTIERSGVALGSGNNVDHFSDILAVLILQNGGNPGRPDDPQGLVKDAITFYTQFERSDKLWDETLPNSTYAFAIEKAAMMIAPSWRAFEIKQINPNFEFEVYPIPQLPGKPVTWGSYWVEGVAKTSKESDVAWKFLKFLSQKETLQSLHTAAAGQRLFGEIYPRMDMAELLSTDKYAGAYIKQAPTAQTWYMASRTFDNGLNDQIIKYYQDAVNAVNAGKGYPEVSVALTKGVQQVLSTYNLKP